MILGHVDSTEYGSGAFYELRALVPGDTIDDIRVDSTTAVFAVDRVVSYPKTQFPTDEVYGDTDDAALRLVTCGGAFDEGSRSYRENVIVNASLAGSAPA